MGVSRDPVHTMFGGVPLTLSLGISVSNADSALTVQELLQQANSALYRAKEKGRKLRSGIWWQGTRCR